MAKKVNTTPPPASKKKVTKSNKSESYKYVLVHNISEGNAHGSGDESDNVEASYKPKADQKIIKKFDNGLLVSDDKCLYYYNNEVNYSKIWELPYNIRIQCQDIIKICDIK